MCRTSIYYFRNHFSALLKMAKDWLTSWRKEHKDELHDLEFYVTPSRECPDYSKDPWV